MRLVKNAALLACLLLALPAVAAEPPLALVRVDSLDGLAADVERIVALTGRELSREQLLAPVAGPLGGGDLSWVDGAKPWLMIASAAALVQGPQALVVAIPARSQEAAVAALGDLLTAADEDGVRSLTTGVEPPPAVLFRDGYLVASPNRDLALAFRPAEAAARGDLPPGNLAVDVNIAAVAPMALSGLEAGRRMLEQRMAAPDAEAMGEAPAEGTEPGADQEAPAGDEPPAQPAMEAAAIGAMLDIYGDLVRNLILNTSRIQMSLEVTGEHLMVHQRILPLAGSTLEGLLAAQKGGLPELARLIDPDRGGFVFTTGQVSLTPEFRAALKSFLSGYGVAMETLFEGLDEAAGAPAMGPWMRAALADVERWPDCYRGDFAASFDVDPERGFQGAQVVGVRDADLCQALIDHMAELSAAPSAAGEGQPLMRAEPEALDYKGVRAMKVQVSLGELAVDLETDDEPLPAWFQEDFVSYTGLKDDLLLSTTGRDSADAFRRLVDQILTEPPTGGGITAELFAPLVAGPGVYATVDLGQMGAMLPADAEERAADLFAALGAGGARLVYGLHLGPGALHAQFAVPLTMISTAAALGADTAP